MLHSTCWCLYVDPTVIDELRPIIEALRGIASERKVLELACGPCFWTQQIASVARAVKATDFNESTLEQARKKNIPWNRVTLEQADAYDLDSISGYFDMVLAVDWLAHVPKRRISDFLSGIAQRVPSGSPLVFIDQLPSADSITGQVDAEGNHIQERTLADGETFRVIKHFFSDEQLYAYFDPHISQLEIERFPDCRRILLHGHTK